MSWGLEVGPYPVFEAGLFREAVSGTRNEAGWLLAISLGLRRGEALGLAWRDVDLDRRLIHVRQALQYRPGDGLHLVQPKTSKSMSVVPRRRQSPKRRAGTFDAFGSGVLVGVAGTLFAGLRTCCADLCLIRPIWSESRRNPRKRGSGCSS